MDIYFKIADTKPELVLTVNDNSYRNRAIKTIHSLTLYYSLPEHIDIPVGAWTVFEGERYELLQAENFKKLNSRNFEYTLTLEDETAKLTKYKYKDTTTRKLKFSHTAKPQGHLKMLVDNLNMRDSGWIVGEYVSATEKTLSFNHSYCFDVLGQIADAFNTEWEVVGKTIHLRKVEYNKDNPLNLSYGRGNGFKPGIGRTNYDSSRPVEILHIQGGDKNINPTKYGNAELLLPKNQEFEYEGRTYISDADGYSISRKGIELKTQEEDSLDCSHIFPQRVGTVSSIVVVDAAKHFYDFADTSIPVDLDYNQCLIDGEKMTVIFQEGMLEGKEFEVKYKHNERKFEIVPQEIEGRTMPDDAFKPVAGHKYAVFGISLPDAYVCNNTTKTGSSWDMFREAAKYFYEHEDFRFTFSGELDSLWAKKDWLNIGGKIRIGGYVRFHDSQFQKEGVLIRIIGVKDYINNPQSPIIDLSNCVVGGSVVSDLNKITENEVVADNLNREALQFTKRRFRDAQESTTMLESALLNFSEAISPVSVSAMQILLGDESLQFIFVNNKTNPVQITHNIVYNAENKILTAPAGILKHMTLGINSLSSSHKVSDYKYWDMAEFNSPPLTDVQAYYLYAKVSKTDTSGVFYLSPKAIGINSIDGFYHLFVGILNSEFDNSRSWASFYGFSELTPGRLTIPLIVSPDGKTYFDVAGGEIGGRIVFKSNSGIDKTLPELEEAAAEDATAKAKAAIEAAAEDATTKSEAAKEYAKAQAEALEYLKTAFKNTTTIEGGIVATTLLKIGAIKSGNNWLEKAGINGAGTGENTVRFYSGGNLEAAIRLVNNTIGTKATYVVTEGGKLFATDVDITGKIKATSGEFTGLIKSNNEGNRIEINPVTRALTMSSNTVQDLAKLWFVDSMASLEMISGTGISTSNMSLTATSLRMQVKGYGRLADFSPMGIIHTGLLKGHTGDGYVNAYPLGTFLADEGQDSNGWAMLRVKIR